MAMNSTLGRDAGPFASQSPTLAVDDAAMNMARDDRSFDDTNTTGLVFLSDVGRCLE
jgi:hypothetical protein